MNQEDASNLLLSFLRNPETGMMSSYGYDVYLPSIYRQYLRQKGGHLDTHEIENQIREDMPSFYAAAWELCRRGILRPGISQYGAQATDDGNAGNGYSFTPFGLTWLEETEHDDYVPTEPGRFAEMLAPFKSKFGPGFHERAQEAVRCYGAHAYLSCCVMCGAATESIVLRAAIEKSNEDDVLKSYNRANGRTAIENLIIGQANEYLKREYKGYTNLLKYWRDTSAHGHLSNVTENEAYTSLALLLRLAAFMSDSWNELTK